MDLKNVSSIVDKNLERPIFGWENTDKYDVGLHRFKIPKNSFFTPKPYLNNIIKVGANILGKMILKSN